MNLQKPTKIEAAVIALSEPPVRAAGLTLWDVRFEKEGASWYLRILIDKETGISLEDCEPVHREIDALIDQQDFVDKIDVLQVGSPGLERNLTRAHHFPASVGKPVKVKLYQAGGDGKKVFAGILSAYDNETVTIETEGQSRELPLAALAKIQLNDLED